MEVLYKSTRSHTTPVTASQAILKGLAEDGGLFVPDHIPTLEVSMKELSKMTYQEVAYEVMKLYLTDFTEEELKGCINKHMIRNLIQMSLHRLLMRMVLIIWNCFTVQRSHSRIWHCQSCRIL